MTYDSPAADTIFVILMYSEITVDILNNFKLDSQILRLRRTV